MPRVVCLVRGVDAAARLAALWAHFVGGDLPDRVRVLPGDLSASNMGISSDELDRLAAQGVYYFLGLAFCFQSYVYFFFLSD